MVDEFNIKDFIEKSKKDYDALALQEENDSIKVKNFKELIQEIEKSLDHIVEKETQEKQSLLRHREALLGLPNQVEYYKNRISEIINNGDYRKAWKPDWYDSLESAVYHEIFGFAGLAKWFSDDPQYKESDACMIIGDRIYFEENGEPVLQPQKIDSETLDRLMETLLLTDPKESRAKAAHELYTAQNHCRTTIMTDSGLTKTDQNCIIFRKYHVKNYTFEEQAKRGTIPYEAIPFFKASVAIGYNVAFAGPVKAAKTTFLVTYQLLENPKLVGLSIESEAEVPFHLLMKDVPIIQLVPSAENLDTVMERVKRSDAKYIIVGEARNGKMMHYAVEVANMGTMRTKVSLHLTKLKRFAYDVGEKITRDCGGDIAANMIKVAETFQYIFEFWPLPQEEQKKRLKAIWEMRFDDEKLEISMHQICKYVPETDSWVWKADIGTEQEQIGMEQNPEAFKIFKDTLKKLEAKSPNKDNTVFIDPYLKVLLRRG